MSESQTPQHESPWWRLPWDMLLEHFSVWSSRRKAAAAFLLVVTTLSCLLFQFDESLSLRFSPAERGGWINELARGLSYWGDFLTFCIPVGALLWLSGSWLKRIPWQRAGVACLLATCLAGLTADLIQASTGRSRPRHEESSGFNGFSTHTELHSFPSGHSATAFGSTTALAICYPPVGIPLLIGAGGVAWSRVYLGAHYPSDILMGSGLGLLFGFMLGKTARRKY